jgi:thiamine pyrophosphokinase
VTVVPPSRHAVVLADGAVPARGVLDEAWPGWDEGVALVVAADGGVRHAAAFGMAVDRWVGDGDSTDPTELEALAARGVLIDRVAVDKDESDTELALLAAVEAGADLVTILGGLGGVRVDHAIANLALLQHPALEHCDARLYDEAGARLSLLVGPDHRGLGGVRELTGRVGDLVSLIPLGESARNVETKGLRYPLEGETLILGRARGLSNVRIAETARVTVGSGRLLVIETPANLRT